MGQTELLQPVGDDWFRLRLDIDSEDVDFALVTEYFQKLTGEPGVKLESTVGSKRISPGEAIHPVAMRLHRTHLPLLGGRGAPPSLLGDFTAPRLPLQEGNPEWWNELRPYQAQTASWTASRCGSLIAHDLGLGKTRTALGAAQWPILVLCPKTAISIWQDECEYAGLRCTTLEGRPRTFNEVRAFFDERKPVTDVWLLNYHVAEQWVRYFCRLGPVQGIHTIICDEAHYLQKRDLSWTETVNGIARERCILLTATPMRNRLRSLWSLLNTACPGAFGKEFEFRKAYCGAQDGAYGLEDGGADWQQSAKGCATLERLRLRLAEVMHKLTRQEAKHEVVPLLRSAHYVQVPDAVLHQTLDDSAKAAARLRGGAQTIAWYTDLRHRMGLLKVPAVAQLVAEKLPQWKRIVVWVWHDDVVTELKKQLRVLLSGDVSIDEILGKTSQKKRNETARLWKAKKGDLVEDLDYRVLLVSIGAGSQAVSFTTAGLAIGCELDWAPLQMQQAEKRTHRFGQIHDHCEMLYCVLKGTIDETIADVLLEKAVECEDVLGEDGQVDQMSALFGVSIINEAESDDAFMARVAARLLAAHKED